MKKFLAFSLLPLAFFLLSYMALACWLSATYLAMQENSFFLFSFDYFYSKLPLQPALTGWIDSLLLQFFRWPLLAALLQALIAWLTMLFLRMSLPLKGTRSFCVAMLPSLMLLLVWPLSHLLQLQVLFMALLLFVYCRLPQWWARLTWSILLLPLGYMLLSMPLLIVLFVLFAVAEWYVHKGRSRTLSFAGLVACSLMLPPIYSQRVAYIPFQNRYSYVKGGNPLPLWDETLRQWDYYHQVVRAAEEERWADMRSIIRESGQGRTRLMQNYLLLAESALGTLPDNLFSYTINNPEDMLTRHNQDVQTCQFCRLFYKNLELWDESFHQAQEYSMLMPDACCFCSLTQMVDYSIREGEYAVAEKFLTILSFAPFYGRFVKEQRERIVRSKKEQRIERPLRADNFVGGYPFNSEMIRLIQYADGNRQRAFDYLLCGLLLQKNLPHFNTIFQSFPSLQPKTLPEPYAQAFRLLQTNGQVPDDECLPGSYYYYFKCVAIPEPNQQMRQSAGH